MWAVPSTYPAEGDWLGSASAIAWNLGTLLFEEKPELFCDMGTGSSSCTKMYENPDTVTNAYDSSSKNRVGFCFNLQPNCNCHSSLSRSYELWNCSEYGAKTLGLIYLAMDILHEHLHAIGDCHPQDCSDAHPRTCDYVRVAQNNFLWLAFRRFPAAAYSCAASSTYFFADLYAAQGGVDADSAAYLLLGGGG